MKPYSVSQTALKAFLSAVPAELERRRKNKIATYFPESGPFRRALYPRHMQFFAAGGPHRPMESCPEGCDGSPHRERCFMAANRVGKTIAGAYEMTAHLTGNYPHWWTGKRFAHPVKAWACGKSNKTVKGILQEELFGKINAIGEGMIPGALIVHRTAKAGIAEGIDTAYIRHASGGTSSVTLKSYEEGVASYYGQAIEVAWADEEAPANIWTELLVRTMTTDGICYLTFTPLQGLTEVVLSFLPNGLPS